MDLERILQQTHNDTIRALVRALDLHAPGEGDHAERVSVYAVATGEELGLDSEALTLLRRAAALHDVGKIAVDRRLLDKPGALDQEELDRLRTHAQLAARVLAALPWLDGTMPMVRHHHERWDGGGYPDGLHGEAIPLGARIIGVAEAFDHMTAASGWRAPVSDSEAIEEVRRCSGAQFDPQVVEAFLAVQPVIQPVVPEPGSAR
jgi:HD-GYP domain-containing protein (c-di-GMP phosphodiesterase class II)